MLMKTFNDLKQISSITFLVFFFIISTSLTGKCAFSTNDMRLYSSEEWSQFDDIPTPLTNALNAYHATSIFNDNLSTFAYNPEAYFNRRMEALDHLLEEILKMPLNNPAVEKLRIQAENKYHYLKEVPKELNSLYIKPSIFEITKRSKTLEVRKSYWFEILDPLHRAGPEISLRYDKWEASEIPSFFIFLEVIEYDSVLSFYAPYKHQIAYFDENQREKCRLDFSEGLIYLNGKLFDTDNYISEFSGVPYAIYVLGEDQEFYIVPHKKFISQHSTTYAAGPVLDAGQIYVKDGKLIRLSNQSGHYAPTHASLLKSLAVLKTKLGCLNEVLVKVLEFDPANKVLLTRIDYNAESFLQGEGFARPLAAQAGWKQIHTIAWNNDIINFQNVNNPKNFDVKERKGNTALHLAAIKGNIECMQLLLEAGANINVKNDITGDTALHTAIRRSQRKAVELLLSFGADSTIFNLNGETPLYLAAKLASSELFDLFINRTSAEFIKNHDWSLLSYAVQNAEEKVYDSLLKKCAKNVIFKKDENENTLMHFAAGGISSDLIKRLIKDGLTLDVCNKDGEYPLHIAATRGKSPIIQYILQETSGAHVRKKNNRGEDPLKQAILSLSKKSLDYLLEFKPDLFDQDLLGMTALHHVAQGRSIRARRNIARLIKHTPYASYPASTLYDNNGHTPIHLAILNENEMFTYSLMALCNAGNIKDANGKDLIAYANECNDLRLKNYLLDKLSD